MARRDRNSTPRKTDGYVGNRHTAREQQQYAALSDKVGHKLAPAYADDIIMWKQCMPPPHILEQWLLDYEDGKWEVPDRIRQRVEAKLDRFHKQEHLSFMRRMLKAGNKALDPVEKTGDMKQPVILKYIADGVNQGYMLHQNQKPQQEQMNVGGLTINIGQKPPPRKLKAKESNQIIDGEFKLLPQPEEVSA